MVTIKGRQVIPVVFWKYKKMFRSRIRGQVDLIYQRNKEIFYLSVVVDVTEEQQYEPESVVGVDMGIVNLAVDSTGEEHSGKAVNNVRGRIARLRGNLQQAGTKSSRRHLKELSGKERRFASNVN
ncbi:MAG: RNA-guided endonuclease TnpB family protein, partial [Candidatus Hodarchaeales archaeon]